MCQTINTDVRITVLQCTHNEALLRDHAEFVWPPCERFREGQEFVSQDANMPEGFCSWAWCDIQKYVLTLARGGDFRGVRSGRFVTCCTDGFRPVFFMVERIEEPGHG